MSNDTLRIVEVAASNLPSQSTVGDMHRGDPAAIIIRGAFRPDVMASAIQRIESGEVTLPRIAGPIFKGCVYGRPIAASAADLSDYLRDVPAFVEGSTTLFGESLQARITAMLTGIAGNLPVELALSANGRPYLPATIRVLLDGDRLPPHAENQTLRRASSQEIGKQIDASCLMSFYIPVQLPERGGVLTVVSLDRFHDGDGAIEKLGEPQAVKDFIASGSTTILPGVGDMLVFDGGRRYHWVSPVEGSRARWTLGGFLALTKDHSRVLFWS